MDKRLKLACEAAREAGKLQLRSAGDLEVTTKGRTELVTQIDFASQDLITRRIREEFPDDAILAEEGDDKAAAGSPRLWVVDPLDGTSNYVHGIPQFAVSIAYAERGRPRVGVVLDPNRDEMFTATAGGGAFLNGNRIAVTARDRIDSILVATGFYYERDVLMESTLGAIGRLLRHNVRGVRRFGSAALDLCWLACGRFDAFFEYRLSPWDFAAGALLVAEAGGRIEDRAGEALNLSHSSVVAANARIFDAFADLVRIE